MSLEYDRYLTEHISNVMRAFVWLSENIFDNEDVVLQNALKFASKNIECHDKSKYYYDEYVAYDEYFYTSNPEECEWKFNEAWLRHIHRNEHHWQHWVLINDDAELGIIAIKMPFKYVIEMICDWWSFSWKTGNLYEIFSWYEKNKDHIILHEKTRATVEDILVKIKTKLDEGITSNLRGMEEV